LYVFVALVGLSNLLDQSLKRLSKRTDKLDWYMDTKMRIRRNVISYFMELLVTTIVLIVFLAYGIPLLTVSSSEPIQNYESKVSLVVFFGIWVLTLYLWEMSYKMQMNAALIVHHLTTVVCIGLAGTHLAITGVWFDLKAFILLGFTALTEQSTFVALILYRMEKWRAAWQCFFFSAIWTVVIKTLFVVLTMYYWGIEVLRPYMDDRANNGDLVMWVYVAWPLALALFGSQLYSAVILWNLAQVSAKKAKLEEADLLYPSLEDKTRAARKKIQTRLGTESSSMSGSRSAGANALFASETMVDLSSLHSQPSVVISNGRVLQRPDKDYDDEDDEDDDSLSEESGAAAPVAPIHVHERDSLPVLHAPQGNDARQRFLVESRSMNRIIF